MITSADVAEKLKEQLENIPSEYWSRTYSIDKDSDPTGEIANVINALMFEKIFTNQNLSVAVVPGVCIPTGLEDRRKPYTVYNIIVYVVVSKLFESVRDDGLSVAEWSEEKNLTDFADMIDYYLVNEIKRTDLKIEDPETLKDVACKITEIEPTEPPEIELEQRVGVSVTSVTYECHIDKATGAM